MKLIAAVIANPDDDAPRLKYAKWLDHQADPRGEFIRVQCELSKLESLHKLTAKQKGQKRKLVKREQKLLNEHFAEWTAQLADLKLRQGQAEFRRGFLWRLELREVDVTDDSLKVLKYVPELEVLDLD